MNERIKQLAEQCESFGSWDNKTYSFDKEKFAVLIVKECMLICRRHPSRNLDNNWDVDAVAPDLVQQFEEYFGVDE